MGLLIRVYSEPFNWSINMDLYRQTNKEFFLATAMLRNAYGVDVMTLNDIESGAWLKENEIQDFTIAYMSGGEL